MDNIKQRYEKLKYKLPSFKELDKYFEVSSIEAEDDNLILTKIRRKMIEKYEDFAQLIGNLLMPEATLVNMHEAKAFHEDNEPLLKLYQKLVFYSRSSAQMDLEIIEEDEARFISDLFNAWKNMLPELNKIMAKLKELWKNDRSIKE